MIRSSTSSTTWSLKFLVLVYDQTVILIHHHDKYSGMFCGNDLFQQLSSLSRSRHIQQPLAKAAASSLVRVAENIFSSVIHWRTWNSRSVLKTIINTFCKWVLILLISCSDSFIASSKVNVGLSKMVFSPWRCPFVLCQTWWHQVFFNCWTIYHTFRSLVYSLWGWKGDKILGMRTPRLFINM